MVAAAAAASFTELERYIDKSGKYADPHEAPMEIFDEVFLFIRGGVEALQRTPPPSH